MTVSECINAFKLYVSSYTSPETVKYYDINLRMFSDYLISSKGTLDIDINSLNKFDYIGYISKCKSKGVKNTSVRTYARAVKVFLRWCYNEGFLLENLTYNVKFPKPDKKIIIPLTAIRVVTLDDSIWKGYCGKRDYLIFHLMLDCGLRRKEVVGLDFENINFVDGYITVVDSKNSKSRIIPLPNKVRYAIRDYTNHWKHHQKGALILDYTYSTRITVQAVNCIFYRLKKVDKDMHPHLLRHTFGTSFILGGGSLEILRVLMGHEDYNVTKEYLHIASQSQIVNLDIYKLDDVFFRAYNYNSERM